MDPVKKIKDHVFALDQISYEDGGALESFIVQVKASLQEIFGPHSPYLTYLGSIRFYSSAVAITSEDALRIWGQARKQFRDLLLVVLQDPYLQGFESWDEREVPGDSCSELDEAERIVTQSVAGRALPGVGAGDHHSDMARALRNRVRIDLTAVGQDGKPGPRELKKIRIDLRNLPTSDDGAMRYLIRRSGLSPKSSTKRVLFISGKDVDLNAKVGDVLDISDAVVVDHEMSPRDGRPLMATLLEITTCQMAVVVLSGAERLFHKRRRRGVAVPEPSAQESFYLGYLFSRLGRDRVVILYDDAKGLCKPTGHFDAVYIPVTTSQLWRSELADRLAQNAIKTRDAQCSFFGQKLI